jgi:hypothetical protein
MATRRKRMLEDKINVAGLLRISLKTILITDMLIFHTQQAEKYEKIYRMFSGQAILRSI